MTTSSAKIRPGMMSIVAAVIAAVCIAIATKSFWFGAATFSALFSVNVMLELIIEAIRKRN